MDSCIGGESSSYDDLVSYINLAVAKAIPCLDRALRKNVSIELTFAPFFIYVSLIFVRCFKLKRDRFPQLDGINYLCNFYNRYIFGHDLPMDWKEYIVLVRKINPDTGKVSVYRPISLSYCVAKLLEGIIKNIIEWFLECNGFFSPSQSGFRKGKVNADPPFCPYIFY